MEDNALQPTQTKPKTILLADDEEFILVAYKDGLERAGYVVVLAHDGAEAVALIKTAAPDLVLLDLIMPKLNGFEVLQAVRADPTLSGIPIAVFTNLSQLSDEQEARGLGAVDFIVKADVSLNDLLARLERLFL
ncbi:response regulator [Aeromicrobium sp.]|nr:response regulator [Candidatus Saccharibacteria bacterium]